MRGKWNHSKRPSEYEVYDNKGNLVFSGTFKDAMKFMEDKEKK